MKRKEITSEPLRHWHGFNFSGDVPLDESYSQGFRVWGKLDGHDGIRGDVFRDADELVHRVAEFIVREGYVEVPIHPASEGFVAASYKHPRNDKERVSLSRTDMLDHRDPSISDGDRKRGFVGSQGYFRLKPTGRHLTRAVNPQLGYKTDPEESHSEITVSAAREVNPERAKVDVPALYQTGRDDLFDFDKLRRFMENSAVSDEDSQ